LLSLYYFAYPPFTSLVINTPVEGSYWIVNKNLIEMAALFVLFMFPTSHITGIDRYLQKKAKPV
jgi:thiosulfate dehydrogenase [quinone] large subunit